VKTVTCETCDIGDWTEFIDADAEMWGLDGYKGCDAELYTDTFHHIKHKSSLINVRLAKKSGIDGVKMTIPIHCLSTRTFCIEIPVYTG